MSATEDRFGVRLAAPPGLGPDGVQEIAAVLSPVTGRPTGELAKALAAGPVVVHTHIAESDARQLVQTFRALGARADLLEAVDPDSPSDLPANATRPLFAISETGQVDKAWRQVSTGARAAVTPETVPPPRGDATELETRRMSAVSADALPKTQPFRSFGDAARPIPIPAPVPPRAAPAQGASAVPPRAAAPAQAATTVMSEVGPDAVAAATASATVRVATASSVPAGAVFRPQSSRAPADTQPIDPAILTSAPGGPATGRAGPAAELATVRFEGLGELDAPPPGADETQPIRLVSAAATQELPETGDFAATRPFQRHPDVAADGSATQPMNQSPVTVRQRAGADPGDADTRPRGLAFGPGVDAPTGRFGHDTSANAVPPLDALETGSIGSVQAGPKIFQLAAPAVGPTETGNLPMQARIDPPSEASMRIVLPDARPDDAPTPPSEGQPSEFPSEAPRPGVYKLPPRRREGEPSVVAEGGPPAIPLPPAAGAPPARPSPTSPAAGAPAPATINFPATDVAQNPRAFPAGQGQIAAVPRGIAVGGGPLGSPSTRLPPTRGTTPSFSAPGQSARAAAAEAAAHHSPATAAWMSVLVPGLGQVYNGQRERAILFALGTPLVIPYLYGIYDAFRTAEDISRGKYAAPDPHARQTAFVGQLALGLVMIFGTFTLALLVRRPAAAPQPVSVVSAPVPAPPVATSPPTAAPTSRAPLGDTLDVPALMKKGRMACNQGLYNECEEIMHEVIAREPSNRDAYNLLVEATQQRKGRPLPGPSAPP